ncbi:MAG: hypothetical protein GXP48_03885 [Acidobacteria bacterium]|nr:hypothetical protein [Acidobacteriota bacterium]
MSRKVRHHTTRRPQKRYLGKYTLMEMVLAGLGVAIILLIVAMIISAIAG